MRNRTITGSALGLALAVAAGLATLTGCSGNNAPSVNLNGATQLAGLMDPGQVIPAPPNAPPNAAGSIAIILTADRTQASISVTTTNISTAISDGHIHRGAPGTVGPIVKTLTNSANLSSGSWNVTDTNQPLTPALAADMLAGNLYIDVHTATNPNGELRGQIKVQ